MKEYLDVVDENGMPTGETVERSVAHREGFPHRTSHLWLVRKRDGRIQVLLQKRAMTKSFPGCYDISSAGHIPAGQDYYPSAIRELKEELGLTAKESELIPCGDMKIVWDDVFFGIPYHDRQYTKVSPSRKKKSTVSCGSICRCVWIESLPEPYRTVFLLKN